MSKPLRLACIDADAPPLFTRHDPVAGRQGYEPAVAELIADRLGRRVEWAIMPWAELLPAVTRHDVDAVLCGQGVIASRLEQVDFTRPYGIFHEGVLTRRGETVTGPHGLRGQRVAAIAGSANMALAETFDGAIVVPFGGQSDDVYAEMLAALAAGQVFAVVDDDVVFVPLGESHPRFELSFVVKTANRWAIGVAKDRPEIRRELDTALADVIADGRLRAVWKSWLPTLDYPFDEVET